MRAISALLACATLASPSVAGASPSSDQDEVLGTQLPDERLARETGKFILPNGVSLALSVTSDTMVNGVAVLRTVFTVDEAARVQVLARGEGASVQAGRPGGGSTAAVTPMGVSVLFDRQSGTRTVTPTFTVASGGGGGKRIGPAPEAGSVGLAPVAVVAGGPALRTPDGLVSLGETAGGAQVTLAGDQHSIAHLVGRSIATAVVNTANDRTFDTVTNIDIDLRDVSPYVLESAALRVEDMALDATRGMVR